MKEIKPNTQTDYDGEDKGLYFDPMQGEPRDGSPVGIKPVCVCGFELVRESADTFRCTGGNHRYRISESEIAFDKFGNPLIKIPEDQDEKNKQNNV